MKIEFPKGIIKYIKTLNNRNSKKSLIVIIKMDFIIKLNRNTI